MNKYLVLTKSHSNEKLFFVEEFDDREKAEKEYHSLILSYELAKQNYFIQLVEVVKELKVIL